MKIVTQMNPTRSAVLYLRKVGSHEYTECYGDRSKGCTHRTG